MVYPLDASTGSELTNSSMTENGFMLDLAKSRYLQINVKRGVLTDSADGLVEDTRSNAPARDGEKYTEEGIYTITATNQYTNQKTTKKIYVGRNNLMKAVMTSGLSIEEINKLISEGATIDDEGTLTLAEESEVVDSSDRTISSSENAENVQDDETGDSGNVTNDTTEAVSTTEDVLATLADNELMKDFNFDNVYDVKATISIPDGFQMDGERDTEGSVTYKNADGTYMHVFLNDGMSSEDYVKMHEATTDKTTDEAEKNEETKESVDADDELTYLYYKLIENDGEKVDERFVGFATDITIGGEVKGCLVVEFYNFYENAEQHPLEVDDLKQYLTSDKIKMEYINN